MKMSKRVSVVEIKGCSGWWIVEHTDTGPVRLSYQDQPLMLDADHNPVTVAMQAFIDRILRN